MNICPISTIFNKSRIFKNTSPIKNIRYNYKTLYTDTISFTRKKPSLKTQIEQMPEASFPSPQYREYLINELSKPNNEKDLIDIHQEYYSGLLECETLDEAKEKYPEFKNVVDIKDIDINAVGQGRCMLVKISKGEFEQAPNLTIDNFSLELLKKYYAETLSIHEKENYWKMAHPTTNSLLSLLNIKMSPEYSKMILNARIIRKNKAQWQNPDYREQMVQSARETLTAQWQDPNHRKKMAELSKTRWQDPDYREKVAEAAKNNWQNSDYRKKVIESVKTKWQNSDYKEQMAQTARATLIAQWQDPEYIMAMKVVKEAEVLAWKMHPECSQVYSDIAKDFPVLKQIIRKKDAHKKLTEQESLTYGAYWKRCHEVKLDVDGEQLRVGNIIAQCQKDILASWGFYEKDRNIYKIAENIGILNP